MDLFLIPLLILPILFMGGKSSGSKMQSSGNNSQNKPNSSKPIPDDIKIIENIPFATGISNPVWPLISSNSKNGQVSYQKTDGSYVGTTGYAFGRPRSNGARIHIGIDLWGNNNDLVVASESGTVVGIQGFLGALKAMLVQGDSGLVILYGEIKDGSWNEFGLKKGSRVERGHAIARLGKNNAGGQMLHFETYVKGTTKNITLKKGEKPDSRILNPTKYLLLASRNIIKQPLV